MPRLSHTWNDRIEFAGAAYQFNPKLPKPCVHPITTPAGHLISGFEMSDHVWHRGLWFTIKFINGENFWEERSNFGTQIVPKEPTCRLISPHSVQINHESNWVTHGGQRLIEERRTLVFHDDGMIDFDTTLLALTNLKLDRTPYTTWGGYGGFSFRASRELHGGKFFLADGQSYDQLIAQTSPWMMLQASVDGGVNQKVSIAMIDHPANPRSPSPWYCKCAGGYTLLNAAFLFNEPMDLSSGKSLRFRYRFAYRDGLWPVDDLSELAKRYVINAS